KGLGEISPEEFGLFIGKDMRLDPVILSKDQKITQLLQYYMGKNTPDRQKHIVNNLRVEVDIAEQQKAKEKAEAEALGAEHQMTNQTPLLIQCRPADGLVALIAHVLDEH